MGKQLLGQRERAVHLGKGLQQQGGRFELSGGWQRIGLEEGLARGRSDRDRDMSGVRWGFRCRDAGRVVKEFRGRKGWEVDRS